MLYETPLPEAAVSGIGYQTEGEVGKTIARAPGIYGPFRQITEKYTVVTRKYDVWSDGAETLKWKKKKTYEEKHSGKSEAMPNGSEKKYKPVFAGGLGGYSFQISYNGNGNMFTWEVANEPERSKMIRYNKFRKLWTAGSKKREDKAAAVW